MDMEINKRLNPSDQLYFKLFFDSLPTILKKLPISQAQKHLSKKPYTGQKFLKSLKKGLDGDFPWIAMDVDLLFNKINTLPALVPKVPSAKRAFREWQRAIKRKGPLSLDRNLIYFRKVLSALLDSPKITDEEKKTIEGALIFTAKKGHQKGLPGLVGEVSKNYINDTGAVKILDITKGGQIKYGVEAAWELPNGNQMIYASDVDVEPYDDEDEETNTPWIERIQDTRPYDPPSIKANNIFNRFSLEDEVKKHPKLTRLERQILLLLCNEALSTREIARELGKPIDSVRRTLYSAKKKMNAWLEGIGMKEVIPPHQGRTDQWFVWLFNPPRTTHPLPSVWDNESDNPSPIKEWFERDYDQDYLKSLIPPDGAKPFHW